MTKAACLERDKRSTAGKRMSALIGQAVEDDDAFWNHSTWDDEKGGDGEESDRSFRESDEDEEDRKDTFDSDFNDSESDDDDEEEEGNAVEDENLRREEKREQGTKRKGAYKEPSISKNMVSAMSAGRELMQKRKSASARKKAMKGEGMNAGIILNFPGAVPSKRGIMNKVYSNCIPKQPEQQVNRIKAPNAAEKNKGLKRSLRASTITTSIQANAARRAAIAVSSTTSSKAKTVKEFTQEELIMEALQDTEGQNERWILSRKRILDEEEQAELKKKLLRQNASKGKVICKTYSRKGCYNTITFPDMDFVPRIFTASNSKNDKTIGQRKKVNYCVITGKVARYRDPKTKKAYYDLKAFRVLRKRFEAGERLEGPIKCNESPYPDLLTSTDESEKSDTVPLPDLLDSLGCSPTNHLLEACDPPISLQSSSDDHELKASIENVSPTNDRSKSDTIISCHTGGDVASTTKLGEHISLDNSTAGSCQTSDELPSIKLIKHITPDKHTSTTCNESESKQSDVIPSKSEAVSVSMVDSQNETKTDLCSKSTKSSEINKIDDGKVNKALNFTPIAESKESRGKNAKLDMLSPNTCRSLKAGHENSGIETSSPKKKHSEMKKSTATKVENKVETASLSSGKTIIPIGTISSTNINVYLKEENYRQRKLDNPTATLISEDMEVKSNQAARVSSDKTVIPTTTTSSISVPVQLKEKDYKQRTFDPNFVATGAKPFLNEQGIGAATMTGVIPTEFMVPIRPSNLSYNTKLTPMKAKATNNTVKLKTVKKKSNPGKYPLYNTAAKKSPAVRKKRKPRKSSNSEKTVSVATTENLASLHAQLASQISPGPSFYQPVSNVSNQHLHHLLSKSNQIPYGYSNPIQPPPVDMASLYALGLTSPLQSIPATFPLSLQHQHLLNQRRNHVPTMNFSQPSPSHLPSTLENLMRAYNILAASEAEQRTTQQQQNYDPSKTKDNGNR